jgi:hypothetical protein
MYRKVQKSCDTECLKTQSPCQGTFVPTCLSRRKYVWQYYSFRNSIKYYREITQILLKIYDLTFN